MHIEQVVHLANGSRLPPSTAAFSIFLGLDSKTGGSQHSFDTGVGEIVPPRMICLGTSQEGAFWGGAVQVRVEVL